MSSGVEFELNGKPCRVEVAEGESLMTTLRERLGITSPKNGCAPQGQCGCCLVLVDGNPKTSCVYKAEKVHGHSVVTLEGLPEDERALLAKAFVGAAALQCGFCTPGLAMRTHALLEKNPDPTRDEVAKAIDGNLCRCTGYNTVIDAVQRVAAARRGEAVPEPLEDGGVGAPLQRVAANALTLGERPYVDDLRVDGMLLGVVVLSEHARAKVLGIDTSAAAAVPGVQRVVTADDVPGDRWYGLINQDWPGLVAVGEEVRCVGDMLAVVCAADEATARKAAALVKVDYEPLPAVLDMEEALKPGAPQVNPTGPNELSRTVFERGDVEAALASSAHVVTGTWTTQRIEHLFLEPESALAVPRDDGKIHLYTQGQGVFDDQRQAAKFLGVDPEEVFVELVPNGGGFGGKEDVTIQPHAALLTKLTGRPAKVVLNREESVRIHPKRHPIKMEYAVGCDADGRLTAIKAHLVGDTGAYASVGAKVLERAAGHACGAYRVDNVRVEAYAARTNNPPCGAMRGFGVNQTAFAIESCVDQLAERVGLDQWGMRWRNALQVGDRYTTGQILEKSVGLKETLKAVKPAYEAAKAAGKPVGIACGMKNSGLGNGAIEWGRARLRVVEGGKVELYNSFTEMGQGLLTILVQFAVEVTGLHASTFVPKVDATFAIGSGQTTGSRATLLAGRAAVQAAEKLKAALDGGVSLVDLEGQVFAGDVCIDDTHPPDAGLENPKTHTSFGFATQVVVLDEAGKLEKVIAAHDVGRAVNPDLCRGQIEGAVHMGLGYALSEELPCKDGMPVTFKLREIGVLRARDMPEVEVHLVEDHEPEGPFGAKGVGEIGLVPTAAAVAGALARFDGTRHYVLPMKDSPAGRAISVGRIKAKDRENWH